MGEKKIEFATFKLCDHTSSSKVAGFKKKISFLLILSPNLIKQIDKQRNKKHPTRKQEKKRKEKGLKCKQKTTPQSSEHTMTKCSY
jgi:hypothetical protein